MSDRIIISDAMLASLRNEVKGMMSEKRFLHVLGVERMAAILGGLYMPSALPTLRAAALLHDITKEYSLEKHLQIYQRCGIMSYDEDLCMPKTMHAKTAAALIPEIFPSFATDEIISAVRWHTTGRADMTLAEKLIYLADYIDDTRTFSDCVELRKMFFDAAPSDMTDDERMRHLDKVMIASFDLTIQGLIQEKMPICRDTVEARNTLIRKLKEYKQ